MALLGEQPTGLSHAQEHADEIDLGTRLKSAASVSTTGAWRNTPALATSVSSPPRR